MEIFGQLYKLKVECLFLKIKRSMLLEWFSVCLLGQVAQEGNLVDRASPPLEMISIKVSEKDEDANSSLFTMEL